MKRENGKWAVKVGKNQYGADQYIYYLTIVGAIKAWYTFN